MPRPPIHRLQTSIALFLALSTSSPLLGPKVHAGILDENGGGGAKPTPPASSAPASASAASSASVSPPSTLQPLKAVPTSLASNDPYLALAKSLAQSSGSDGKLYVSIGNFLDGETDELSPRSTEVKEELAIALPKTGKFEIITREHLADLQNEGKFQASDLVQPVTGSNQVGVKAVNGIIRGRISSKPDGTIVYAAIAYLNGGEVREVKAVIPPPGGSPGKEAKVAVAKQSQPESSIAHQVGKKAKQAQGKKDNPSLRQSMAPNQLNAKPLRSDHPFVNLINRREQRLENQVSHALANGIIKPKEATEIRDGIQKIKRQEKRFLLQNDGFLTKPERDQLNQEEDQLAQQIRKDKKANRRN